MADQKITELTAQTALTDTDLLPVVDDVGGTPTTKKIAASNLKNYFTGPTLVVGSAGADYITDGTADDVQIQAAIDALPNGGTIYLKPGTYDIATPITIDTEKGLHLMGSGVGTILMADSGLDDYVIKFTPTANGVWAKLSHFKIDGDAANQTGGGGIYAPGAIECVFDYLWLHQCYDWGIYLHELDDSPLEYGHNNRITNCTFDQGDNSGGIGGGLYMRNCDENHIQGNNFNFMGGSTTDDGNDDGYCIKDETGLNTIINNSFTNSKNGVVCRDASNTIIANNVFDQITYNSIQLRGRKNLVMGNEVFAPGHGGSTNVGIAIQIEYYGQNNIIGNRLTSHSTNDQTRSFIKDNGDSTDGGENHITGNYFEVNGDLGTGEYETVAASASNIVNNNYGLSTNQFSGTVTIKDYVNNKSFDLTQDAFYSRIKSYNTGWVIESANFSDILFEPSGGNGNGQLKINSPLVVNDGQSAFDTTIKGDTDAALFVADASADKVGIGTATPDEKLHVIGNFQVDDADTATKGYRFRTSASNLDLDASGASLFISNYSGAGFTGTQRQYVEFGAAFEFEKHYKKVIFVDGAGSDSVVLDPGNGVVINESGADDDVRIEGDTDTNLVFVDASTDKVGIGNAAPDEKLHVTGNIKTSKSLMLTPSPAADVTESGIIAPMTAGESLAFGDVVYIKSDGKMGKGDADAIATSTCVAMALGTIANDATGNFLFNGFVRNDAWSWTVGGTVYLSLTAGGLTQTAPSATDDVVQIMGVATHADRMYFNPQLVQIERT